MFNKRFKTELHAHTKPASSCSDILPEELVDIYEKNGYTSVTVTNHFCYDKEGRNPEELIKGYLEDYYKAKEYAKNINVILGAEIRFTENSNDYLVFGINESDFKTIFELLPFGVENFYKNFKNDKNIIIQAHPFRNGMEEVNPEFLDGIEVFNMHPNHNSRVALAEKKARENNKVITCGSDFHHFGQECITGIITNKPIFNSFELAKVLKEGKFIMNICGYDLKCNP